MQNPEWVLTAPPAKPDLRLLYGTEPTQFIHAYLPAGKKSAPAVVLIHGGYWRARYNLDHASHLCAALAHQGIVALNVEYRRVGDPGGAWPGTFEDIRSAWRFVSGPNRGLPTDPDRISVMGHSAGGQLALCLAAHDSAVKHAISLAGVLDLYQADRLHLSNDAVAEYLGGTPQQVPEHYAEASPSKLHIAAKQHMCHGTKDDTVPFAISKDYVAEKKKAGENVQLIASPVNHFDWIDPKSMVFASVLKLVS
jgi:acetyl esterase/lipase